MTARTVSLTFDNGPTADVTIDVLAVLARHRVPATFFAIGHKLATPAGRAIGREIVAAGHRLGGHTFSHSNPFGTADDAVVSDELRRTGDAVEAAGGDRLLFRPYGSGGVIDQRLMSRFGADTLCTDGYTCVLWNVVPGDWHDQAGWVAAALLGIVSHPAAVVVLHDIAAAALPRLDEFIEAVGSDVTWSLDFPDECTPIRKGSPTSSFDMLFTRT
jgi:peptidoglycan/xylan/chitin deacetylase (PgdA/CDA1 family)